MEKYSVKHLREQATKALQEQTAKLKKMHAEPTMPSKALPILTREEMVPYKHMRNLAELPLRSTYMHRYCNRRHRALWAKETGCQAGRWHKLPGWGSFGGTEGTRWWTVTG